MSFSVFMAILNETSNVFSMEIATETRLHTITEKTGMGHLVVSGHPKGAREGHLKIRHLR
ncbi:MAG: hypothetical protein FJ015_06615 [Chloroflexi bacterium]|nr:hypothetical protein [Chloroflexota bacterium]